MTEASHIIGIDESGTGSWAGSFYLSAVAAPAGWYLNGIRDSKKTNASHRLRMVEAMEHSYRDLVHVESGVSPDDIEEHGQAGAYARAFEDVATEAVCLLPVERSRAKIIVDGVGSQRLGIILKGLNIRYQFLPKADTLVQQVAAASIFAKFRRDIEMNLLDKQYPQYKFQMNAGYGTPEHIQALKQYGPIPHVHRKITRSPQG